MRKACQICSVPGGKYGAVVNADGRLYSCWQSAGRPGFDVGEIESGYLDATAVADRWIMCGDDFTHIDPEAMAQFHDRVDSRILDYLYVAGRL